MGDDEACSVEVDDFVTILGLGNAHGVGQSGTATPLDAEAKSAAKGGVFGFEEGLEFRGCFFGDGDHVFGRKLEADAELFQCSFCVSGGWGDL